MRAAPNRSAGLGGFGPLLSSHRFSTPSLQRQIAQFFQHQVGQAGGHRQAKLFVQRRPAQVAIDQDGAPAALGHRHGQIGDGRRFALARRRRGDDQRVAAACRG
jgi:hypothetical protein